MDCNIGVVSCNSGAEDCNKGVVICVFEDVAWGKDVVVIFPNGVVTSVVGMATMIMGEMPSIAEVDVGLESV